MNEMRAINTWENVKGKLFLRLTNYDRNRSDIEKKIYVKFLDLAILLYCDCREWGFEGFYVNKKHLLLWNQSIKNIFAAALENTFCRNNTFVTHITNLLPSGLIHSEEDETDIADMDNLIMVLTNKAVHFGAAMLLNLHELKKLADQVDSDLYLLPSSVHEILAIRTDQHEDVSFLTDAVNAINYYEVKPEDYLSDNVYYFDRENCEVTIAVPA